MGYVRSRLFFEANFVSHAKHFTDASRTPPSRFQKRKGSLLATRASRFGGGRLPRSTSKERDREYFQKIQEKVRSKKACSSALWQLNVMFHPSFLQVCMANRGFFITGLGMKYSCPSFGVY